MKYSISSRHGYPDLKKADEIRVAYKDRDKLLDFVEKIPDSEIVLELPPAVYPSSDYEVWKMYSDKFTKFTLATKSLGIVEELNATGLSWYWPYPITTYYELKSILALGASQIALGPPLCFDLETVKRNSDGAKIRICANMGRPEHLPLANPHKSFWIRPEDINLYEPYVDYIEFTADTLAQELMSLKVYKYDQKWPGNLNLLIPNLNLNVDNRIIPEGFGLTRLTCGQRCYVTGVCNLCKNVIDLAMSIKKRHDEKTLT